VRKNWQAVSSENSKQSLPELRPRILLVPDWLQWITGTIAKAIKAHNPDLEADIVPMGVVQMAIQKGWNPSEQFDVVHFLTTQATERAGASLLGKIPAATTMHHIHDEADLTHDLRGDAIMVSCSQWENDLLRRGVSGGKIVRVPYGVETRDFRPPSVRERETARKAWGLDPNEVAIGFVGKKGSDNFGRKGFDIFCAGILALREKGVRAVPMILGSGWQEDLQKNLGKEFRAVHQPFVPQQSVFYHAMDYYWVASRIEGGPVPLLEAMASGIPCLARPVGMVEDVLTNQLSDWVVRSDRPTEFADKTATWVESSRLRQEAARAARDRIVEAFDWSISAPKALALYQKAWDLFQGQKRADLAWRQPDVGRRESFLGSLDQVETMIRIPRSIRGVSRFREDSNMVNELFRVKNRQTASALALRLAIQYPEKAPHLLANILLNAWIRPSRMALGRWKQKILKNMFQK